MDDKTLNSLGDSTRDARGASEHPTAKPLSAFGAWALGFGCAVGWGSFVMPGTSFLPNAGPLGTAIAFAAGSLIMAIIAVCYRFMMERYPVSGGAFVFAHKTFGHEHGFACGWFLLLAFTPLVAQNITAISLLSRNLLSNIAEAGFNYSLAGYQVYLAEIVIDITILAVFAFLLSQSNRLGYILQCIFVICMVAFLAIMLTGAAPHLTVENLQPLYSPTKNPALGMLVVLSMAPWAFVGFDAISQTTGEFSFPVRRAGLVMVLAIIAGYVFYTAYTVVTAAVTPQAYATWADYLAASGKLSGIDSIPLFCAMSILFGDAAIPLLTVAVMGSILSGVVGFSIASSRVFVAMAEAGHLPEWLAQRDPKHGTPKHALCLTFAIAAGMTLLGRSILTWIMDIASIGAALSFLYTSAATMRTARAENRPLEVVLGGIGTAFSIVFVLLLVLPIPQIGAQLQVQSLVFLAAWVALGMNFYMPPYEKPKRLNLDEHLTSIDS